MTTVNVVSAAPPPVAPVIVTQTTEKRGSSMRRAIPELPVPLAIFLGITNFIFPGLGTIGAGFSVLCCGNVGESGASKVGTCCINFWVGILQMLTVVFFLLGWFWSIIWGIAIMANGGGKKRVTTTTTVTAAPVVMAPTVITTTS